MLRWYHYQSSLRQNFVIIACDVSTNLTATENSIAAKSSTPAFLKHIKPYNKTLY